MAEWKSQSNLEAFYALDKEKQKRIISASLNEFAQKGYKQASTNQIAKNATIGKGMLFYYFGSKEELFDYLCAYSLNIIKNNFIEKFNCDSNDFIERYLFLSDIKKKAIAEFPEVLYFFERSFREENKEYFSKFSTQVAEAKQLVFSKIYNNIDYSLFREDMDPEVVMKHIKWVFAGYEQETTARVKSGEISIADSNVLETEWKSFYKLIDDLKKAYYKSFDKGEN